MKNNKKSETKKFTVTPIEVLFAIKGAFEKPNEKYDKIKKIYEEEGYDAIKPFINFETNKLNSFTSLENLFELNKDNLFSLLCDIISIEISKAFISRYYKNSEDVYLGMIVNMYQIYFSDLKQDFINGELLEGVRKSYEKYQSNGFINYINYKVNGTDSSFKLDMVTILFLYITKRFIKHNNLEIGKKEWKKIKKSIIKNSFDDIETNLDYVEIKLATKKYKKVFSVMNKLGSEYFPMFIKSEDSNKTKNIPDYLEFRTPYIVEKLSKNKSKNNSLSYYQYRYDILEIINNNENDKDTILYSLVAMQFILNTLSLCLKDSNGGINNLLVNDYVFSMWRRLNYSTAFRSIYRLSPELGDKIYMYIVPYFEYFMEMTVFFENLTKDELKKLDTIEKIWDAYNEELSEISEQHDYKYPAPISSYVESVICYILREYFYNKNCK